METIHERIAILVDKFGRGRNTVFASLIGSNEGNIRGYVNKGVTPKQDVLERIVKSTGISAEWLLMGVGPMMPENKPVVVHEENRDMVSIPLVDIGAAAGVSGYINPDYLEVVDRIEMPCNMIGRGKNYFCIRVKGESMAPTLLDSGYLVVRLLERGEWGDIRDNQVYVISTVEGHAYVKRVKNRLREKGFIVCSSDNPDKVSYPNFNLQQDELNTVLYVEWYFTAKIPNIHETYYKKVEILEDRCDVMQVQLEEIQKRLKLSK